MTGMFAAISPSDDVGPATVEPAFPRVAAGHGRLELAFARRGSGTALARLYQKTPMRAFLPRDDCGNLAVAVTANVGGGLVGGDHATIDVKVGPGAAAMVTTQAAEKVYRSVGPDCVVENRLAVGEAGWLEWCPQETILFDRGRLRRRLVLDLAANARATLGETVVLGRLASGERTDRGLLHDQIEVRTDGVLRWRDVFRLEGSFAELVEARAGLAGARVATTFVHAGPDAAERLELARDLLPAGAVRSGATVLNGLLVARLLAEDPLALRGAFALFWSRFRAAVAGLPPVLPRLWHV